MSFIWGVPWLQVRGLQPDRVTDHYTVAPADLLPGSPPNLDRVERLDIITSAAAADGSTVRHTSAVFIYHPKAPNGRLVIVHHGHGCAMNGADAPYNLDATIRALVDAGFAAAAMRMPLFQAADTPCGSEPPDSDHDTLMQRQLRQGSPLRFFLEPVAKTLNYVETAHPLYFEFDMLGLSGGGWTTTFYPAVDPRIVQSFPVAGSIPLYLRGHNYPDDLEQYDAAVYSHAGYKDLYVLGSLEAGRRQTQILNKDDDCCFGERQDTVTPPPYTDAVNAYAHDVSALLSGMGTPGQFSLVIDLTAHTHQISTWAIGNVILPGLKNDADLMHDRVFVYNAGAGSGAVGHVDAASHLATDSEEAPGTFGKWTQITPLGGGRLFFYNGPDGAGAVGHVTADSRIATEGEQPRGSFGAWTHIVGLGEGRLFFYNAQIGAGATGHATADGKIATDRELGPGTFGAWTHIAALGGGRLFFYNSCTGAGAIGHPSADGSIATDGEQGPDTFGRWTHIVGLGGARVFAFNANTGAGAVGHAAGGKLVTDGEQAPGSFGAWTHVIGFGDGRLFFYNQANGAGAVGHATADGKIATDGEQAPGSFGNWTAVSAL